MPRVAKITIFSLLCLLVGCSSSSGPVAPSASSLPAVSLPTSTDVVSHCKGAYSLNASESFTEGSSAVTSDGSGLDVRLTVVEPVGCAPVKDVEVDLWHNGPEGVYSESWRSKQRSNATGQVSYRTAVPVEGEGPRHVHVRAVYRGFAYWWVLMVDEPSGSGPLVIDVTLVLASIRVSAPTTVPPALNY